MPVETGRARPSNRRPRVSRLYFLYILECRDGAWYTGITTDLARRLEAHARGKGSKYVFSRRPFRLVHQEVLPSRGDALRKEAEIKRMKRVDKLAWVGRFKPH